ncbi:Mitochondrial fission process protein 1 [Colletotrichum sp. SAR 10_96]|uniref:Mitochondrial fission process protein 1 n=1 Tax=Colletotrichum siamense TaxID=690259 RepID=UPI0018731C8F|nr:Mitochondrial fission process protein 1 [Colletotrichum siamense]KAF5497159.1 Mitochondrial fission process protein 1 [Colletotrichum siamense]KAI8245170.1 Mitochondrial fission process protein 1 [Colletotrichum sp. SAR 10_96]
MWWGRSSDKKPEESKEATNNENGAKTFDPEKLPPRQKLPKALQNIIDKSDKEENFFDELVDGYAPESTESNVRYMAYATRVRTILLSAHRYVAYTSDIGESFRPVAHPYLVRGAYGISWLYILGDVSYEGYKAYWANQRILNPHLQLTERQAKITGLPEAISDATHPSQVVPGGKVAPLDDYRTVMVQRGIFQSIASMGLPAFTIHSVVRYSGRAMKNVKNARVRTWGPIGLGLAVVPFLPSLFDEPVENAVEWIFHKGFETYGGKDAVGDAPATGREDLLAKRPKEKEL